MINSIELSNWKTHKSTRLEFSKGANILIGQMGSGKSSVMDAISYALFGNFPSIQHRKTNVSYLIRSKPRQEESASIRLSFEADGHSYEVERTISMSSSSTATLKRDGIYLQSQPQRVTEEIVKALKMDYDLFSRAVYSQQNGLEYFLNLGPTVRKKEIDKLLGLDKFSEAKDNVTTLANRIKDIIKEDSRAIADFDAEKMHAQISSIEKELAGYRESNAAFEKRRSSIKEKLASSEASLNSVKEQLSRKNKLLQEIKELSGRADTYKSEIRKIDAKGIKGPQEAAEKLSEAGKRLESALAELKKAAKHAEERGESLANANAQLQSARKDNEKAQAIAKELEKLGREKTEKEMLRSKEAMEKAEYEMSAYSAEKKETEKNLNELESHFGKCPVCEKELEESLRKKLIGERVKRVKELSGLAAAAEKLALKSRKEYESLSNNISRIQQLEETLKGYSGILERVKEHEKLAISAQEAARKAKVFYEEKEKLVQAVKDSVAKLQAELDSAQTRERHAKELDLILKSVSEKERSAKSITLNEEAMDKLHKEVVELSSQITRLESDIESNRKYMKDRELQKKEKEEQLSAINRLKGEISRKSAVHASLEKFSEALAETQAQLRSRLVDSINGVMGNIWPDLYPYRDYTDIMLDAVEDDYLLKVNTMIREKRSWEDVEEIASGGERSTACLAMRIAFSLVLAPNIKWLILDEPTHNLDQQAVQKLVGIFSDTLPKIIDQIFIITHDDLLREVRYGNVYLLDRDKAQDLETGITQV